jgi:hypothetical protein
MQTGDQDGSCVTFLNCYIIMESSSCYEIYSRISCERLTQFMRVVTCGAKWSDGVLEHSSRV